MIRRADGGQLACRQSGSGTPIILVHGSPGDGRSWGRVVPRLAERHRVLMPDLPGYGGSDPLPPGGVEQHTAAMAASLDELVEACEAPALLVGHSFGGNVALHAALRHIGRIRGAILFEPVFMRALGLAGDTETLAAAREFFGAYADRVAAGESGAVSAMIDYWFGDGAFARLSAPVQDFLRGAAARNAADVRGTFAEQITMDQLGMLSRPVTVAYGAASPPVVSAIARALGQLVLDATVRPIAGAAHGMLDSHPDAMADLILGFAE